MKKVLIVIIILIIILIIIYSQKTRIDIKADNIKKIHYSYSTGNMIYSNVSYEIEENNGKYTLTIKPNNVPEEEKTQIEIEEETLNKIVEILNKYDVKSWNNFHKSNKNIMDGNSFSFRLKTKDNNEIDASGYMKYPKNDSKVKSELESIFENLIKIKNVEELEYLNFSYSTGNMIDSNVYYKIEKKKEKYTVTIKPNNAPEEEAKQIEIKKEKIQELEEILNKFEVSRWDGFQKNDPNVLDGDSFSFILKSKDLKVTASGYMMWPNNYKNVKKNLDDFFETIYFD